MQFKMASFHWSSGSAISTIGYEGHDLRSFIEALESNGVQQLVDVRELPLSRKRGFSKTALAAELTKHGIEYVHLRGLGAPRAARHGLRVHGDFDRFAEEYSAHLGRASGDLKQLKAAAVAKRTAIMCVEKDEACCHRGLIGRRLARAGFDVIHLR